MSENAQVKKLIQAYESLEDALDGFDWGTPQRCVLGSFTVDGVDGPGRDLPPRRQREHRASREEPRPLSRHRRGLRHHRSRHRHRGFVALAPMDFDDGEGTWAWVRME